MRSALTAHERLFAEILSESPEYHRAMHDEFDARHRQSEMEALARAIVYARLGVPNRKPEVIS
jgi:hypothetical protein